VTPILTVILLAVVAWFAAGMIWNIRKGSAAMRWMQGGLPLLGERTTVRWLGTSSVELAIPQAKPPFAQVVLIVFLEPRDVPWLWAVARSRGRRDTLIIRAGLRRTPKRELEVLDRSSWSGREALRRVQGDGWSELKGAGPGGVSLLVKLEGGGARDDSLLDLARGAGMSVRRLSVGCNEPHLELHVDLPPRSADAAGFFSALRGLGERAGR
jgi:hypothetical protein